MKKVLVIGHKGFIGSGLKEYFETKMSVVGWGREENIFTLNQKRLAETGVEAVVNCSVVTERSAKIFLPGSPSDEIIVQGARHLAQILRGTDVGWIQISTKDVFGNIYLNKDVEETDLGYWPKFLVDDAQAFNPQTLYAKAKLMAEFVAESHPHMTIIRLSTCYTAHDHSRANWMVKMIKQIGQGETVTLLNGGKQFRDPLHVEDLGRLIESVVDQERWGLKMNAGGGADNIISIVEFARLIDPKVKIKAIPGDDFGFAFNNRLAADGGHWKPSVKIREYLPKLTGQLKKGVPSI